MFHTTIDGDDIVSLLTTIMRDCLYSVAPVYIWQFYSNQSKYGTSKGSLAKDLPQLYRALMTAA